VSGRMLCCAACGPGAYLLRPGGAFPAGFRSGAVTGGSAGAGAEAGGADSGGGAGAGAADGNSLCTAASGAADVGGAVTTGAGNDGATTGATVVGTGFVSDCDGQSTSLSTAVMIPKPTSGAARHTQEEGSDGW
jgi:hypothetical protein